MSRLTRETVSGTWNSLGQERRGRKKIIDIDSFIHGHGRDGMRGPGHSSFSKNTSGDLMENLPMASAR